MRERKKERERDGLEPGEGEISAQTIIIYSKKITVPACGPNYANMSGEKGRTVGSSGDNLGCC